MRLTSLLSTLLLLYPVAHVAGDTFSFRFSQGFPPAADGFHDQHGVAKANMRWGLVVNTVSPGPHDFSDLDRVITEGFNVDTQGRIGSTDYVYVFGSEAQRYTSAPPGAEGAITFMSTTHPELTAAMAFAIIWFPDDGVSVLGTNNYYGYLTSASFIAPTVSGSTGDYFNDAVFVGKGNFHADNKVNAVPEPAVYSLVLAAGVAGIAIGRRRVRKVA